MEKDQVINIVLVGYINRNLGDPAIAECARYILEESLDMAGIEKYYIHLYNMYIRDMAVIEKADAIVFAGGGLIKYKRELFYEFIPEIIEVAQKNDIPIYFNCVGVEGYSETDSRCQVLKKAVNSACVKGITIRDDYDLFVEHYLRKDMDCRKVLDPVSLAAEVYHINDERERKKVIGLQIARPELYEDYGVKGFSREHQLEFWKQLIDKIESETEYKWQIFSNGLLQDYMFHRELLAYLGKEECEEYLVPRPAEVWELVTTISEYSGIVATRLHGNIIAYAVNVPSIGLVWNDKMVRWGESIGYKKRFLDVTMFDADIVFNKMMQAMEEGIINISKKEKINIEEPLVLFLKKYCVKNSKKEINAGRKEWPETLISSAMGGHKYQYAGMNSLVTFENGYNDGFRNFEVDLKLSSDNKLVCVNGWNESTYKKLGLMLDGNTIPDVPTHREFMKMKYYGHYPTSDFVTLFEAISSYPDISFVFDIRSNTIEQMEKIVSILSADKYHLRNGHFVRVSTVEDAKVVNCHMEGIGIILDISSSMLADGFIRPVIFSELGNLDVQCVSFQKGIVSERLVQQAKCNDKKIFAFNTNSFQEAEKMLNMGVDYVGTDYLCMEGLLKLEDN
ncbi:polysaccharide pyruvyl transferase family protein [Konateibacter massiliensis]|uniref:polysaccharide pyruvyl transferase family protein n=1 Tax=Konateibacter massiliensis TaxID=2002841 RepID=UPI000C14C5C8|nr:polysaccharide pyruvyl transferase family protein [Konateibacter massiliensis]